MARVPYEEQLNMLGFVPRDRWMPFSRDGQWRLLSLAVLKGVGFRPPNLEWQVSATGIQYSKASNLREADRGSGESFHFSWCGKVCRETGLHLAGMNPVSVHCLCSVLVGSCLQECRCWYNTVVDPEGQQQGQVTARVSNFHGHHTTSPAFHSEDCWEPGRF